MARDTRRQMIEGAMEAEAAHVLAEVAHPTISRPSVVCDEETIEASLRVAGLASGAPAS